MLNNATTVNHSNSSGKYRVACKKVFVISAMSCFFISGKLPPGRSVCRALKERLEELEVSVVEVEKHTLVLFDWVILQYKLESQEVDDTLSGMGGPA